MRPHWAATGLWLIDGDKLVLLRAFEAGGFKAEIEFSGKAPDLKCTYPRALRARGWQANPDFDFGRWAGR